MNFRSDNTTGAAPEVLAALVEANAGPATPYGADPWTARAEVAVRDVFETDCAVFLVATGTAANALALSAMAPPFGAVLCHPEAHVMVDECGAPELFTGGAKLIPLPDRGGRITAADLDAFLALPDGGVHRVRPAAVSLTQAAETGVVYAPGAVADLAAVAHGRGLKVHMDGARFANAVAALGCTPAEASWRAGVDILCLGASKNGALAAEAVVVFDPALAAELPYRRKRGGHLLSKGRFLGAQMAAYLADGLWLGLAARANAAAARLAAGLGQVPGVDFVYPVEANELFVVLPPRVRDGLRADGFQFLDWDGPPRPGDGATVARLVTAFDTRDADVDALAAAARRHASPGPAGAGGDAA
ncbi:MAG: low specificity L-threonine aldolase [Hyphomicrobiales bacterium]|nr:low specificity L-threonine aldolase [Hyphomicrobiales bacterium]MCP5370795.1 low specificity L-threonine aldolase [Hyphomicrobiales bacterium]